MIIAIQPDNYGPDDSSSPIWTRLLQEAGHDVREVDVYRSDILDQLRGCHGFMWRHAHTPGMRQIAKRLLPVIERELGLVVYPDQNTCWHYDDKIAQKYLLETVGIPTPKTWIWFDKDLALKWARTAEYPLVLKLWAGAGSSNVRLVPSYSDAEKWILRLFVNGVENLDELRLKPLKGLIKALLLLYRGEIPCPWELHKNYVLFQKFLPGNDFDTRITVIGKKAFGFRRFNRPEDFRASGSGIIDHDPAKIDMETVRLAFDVSRKLNTQSIAIDGLRDGEKRVVGEVSYTYASWAVHACPGHWDSELNWHAGQLWPEEAQVHVFMERLNVVFGERKIP